MSGPSEQFGSLGGFFAAPGDERDPWRVQMQRLATAARELNSRLSITDAPVEEVARAADALEAVLATIREQPAGRPYFGVAESSLAGPSRTFRDFSPLSGVCNPLSPPLDLHYETDRVAGTGSFGWAYEGPPGCVHGGYVAAAFDELLGMTQTLSGHPGMTGRLTVWYRRPTPLHAELRFEGVVTEVSGRKVLTKGTLHHGETLCAEAEGLFISVDTTKFVSLVADRSAEQRSDPPTPS